MPCRFLDASAFFTLDELKARRGEADVVVGEYWKKD